MESMIIYGIVGDCMEMLCYLIGLIIIMIVGGRVWFCESFMEIVRVLFIVWFEMIDWKVIVWSWNIWLKMLFRIELSNNFGKYDYEWIIVLTKLLKIYENVLIQL